jgi:hypothetical protein
MVVVVSNYRADDQLEFSRFLDRGIMRFVEEAGCPQHSQAQACFLSVRSGGHRS